MTNGKVMGGRNIVGIGLRLVAIIIDMIVLFILGYVIALVSGQTTAGGFQLSGAPFFVYSLLSFAYFILMEAYIGGTLGKLVLGLRVEMEDGSPCTIGGSLIRNLLRIVDGLPYVIPYLLGAIFVWTSETKQRLGDRLAKTYVVKK